MLDRDLTKQRPSERSESIETIKKRSMARAPSGCLLLSVTGALIRPFSASGMAYAVLVTSKLAKGRIVRLDIAAAEASDTVVRVLTHDAMRLTRPRDVSDDTVRQPADLGEVGLVGRCRRR